MTLFIIIPTMTLVGLAVDMYIPSLPAITHYFQAETATIKFSVGIFVLAYSLSQLAAGILTERWGRRPTFILGMLGFVLSSLLAARASSPTVLLLARALQGASIAAPGVVSRALLMDLFSGSRLNQFSNYFGIGWSLGVIVAPLIGGYLQHYFNWQASFFVLMAYALVLLCLALRFMPETRNASISKSYAHLTQQIKAILSHRYFLTQTLMMSLAYSVMVIFHVVGPFLIEEVMHYSVKTYGTLSLGLGIAWLLGSTVNRLMVKAGMQTALVLWHASVYFMLVATIMILLNTATLSIYTIMLPIYIAVFFAAILFINGFGNVVHLFKESSGLSSALIGTMAMFGAGCASSLASLLKSQSGLPLSSALLVLALMIFYLTRVSKP